MHGHRAATVKCGPLQGHHIRWIDVAWTQRACVISASPSLSWVGLPNIIRFPRHLPSWKEMHGAGIEPATSRCYDHLVNQKDTFAPNARGVCWTLLIPTLDSQGAVING